MMGYTLRYEYTCPLGSVEARGISFLYSYVAAEKMLRIFEHHNSCTPLISIACPKIIAHDPRDYIEWLEKTSKIKALILSNNLTIRLIDTMQPNRLGGILDNMSYTARASLDLQGENFKTFSKTIIKRYGLKEITIKPHCCHSSGTPYYRAMVKTDSNNEIVVRHVNLSGLMRKTSEGITRDLITREFSSNNSSAASTLLMLSSKLSIMSRVMDPYFAPESFVLTKPKHFEDKNVNV